MTGIPERIVREGSLSRFWRDNSLSIVCFGSFAVFLGAPHAQTGSE